MNQPCDFTRQRSGPVSSVRTKPRSLTPFRSFHRCIEPITTSFRYHRLFADDETKPELPLPEAPGSLSIDLNLDHEPRELLSSAHSHETSLPSLPTSLTVNCEGSATRSRARRHPAWSSSLLLRRRRPRTRRPHLVSRRQRAVRSSASLGWRSAMHRQSWMFFSDIKHTHH